MNIKKYFLIIIILLIFLNLTCIYATENNTEDLATNNENNLEDILCQNNQNYEDTLSQNDEINQTNQEILTLNKQEDTLSDFEPYNTEITLIINDTGDSEVSGNITVDIHFSFTTPWHDGEFPTYDFNVYENNTIIKKINIGDQNLPEIQPNVKYTADILFNYTIHSNSYLTTSLFGVYSNTLKFEKIKNTIITNLNNTQINIDNTYTSNKTWNNSVESLRKAIMLAKNNGTINLNNILLIQDTDKTIPINKNMIIIGNDASFLLQKTQTLLEITQNAQVTLINLTFNGNNNYIISNKGKLQLINCTFKDNSFGLINNDGELEINNCNIHDINQFYQTRTVNSDGLITNNGIIKITNTIFNNNNLLPFNFPIESTTLKGIIYNNGALIINDTNFTNINYRLIHNDGEIILKNILFDNIITTSTSSLYVISINQQLNQNYTYKDYKIKSNVKTIDGGVIYNNKNLNIINSLFNNIVGSNGGAIYNTNNLTITNTTFHSTTGNNGGAIYNTNNLTITNTTFHSTTGNNGGAIYNTNQLTIENSLFNNTQSKKLYNGGSIYNKGECTINNSIITESKITISGYGGGIYNEGILAVNNTLINKCHSTGSKFDSASGIGIYNKGIMAITNSQIINNHAPSPEYITKEVEQPDGSIFIYITNIYAGVISNSETGKATIIKSIIKDNTISHGTNQNWNMYYGTIKNDGEMEISGCIFGNNTLSDWNQNSGGEGSINLYNTGKLTVIYTYLLDTQTYSGSLHDPMSFLYNSGITNLNYNFYCLNPNSIIRNANPNYYFIPSFKDDYCPIKLNQNVNITITLVLTNGLDTIQFNDWDKLPGSGLNMSIYMNSKTEKLLDALLQNNITFNFNNTNTKGEYTLFADFGGYTTNTIVDIGKEFADMIVEYNNVTYNDGNNVTFKIKVTDNNTPVSGNITLTFNNQIYQIRLNNGTCNFTMPSDLKPNNYTVKIEYNGNEDYFKIRNHYYQFTIHKIQTNITLDAPEVKIGQNGELTIKISPSTANMNGILYVDGKAKTRADTNSIRIINLKNYVVGVYNLTVVFDDDEYYLGGTASTIFIVSKYETNLTVESHDIKAGENETLNITINPGNVRGNAVLQINNETRNIFINDTTTPITLTDLEEGTYQVTVYYPGDAKYSESTAATTFSVSRITSHLTVDLTQNINLTGSIKIHTNPLNCTGEVAIYVNNDVTLLNLTNGSVKTQIKLKRGSNYIYVHYNGDRYYSISSWNTSFTIEGIPVLSLETQKLETDRTGYVRINLTDTNNIPYEYTDITIEFQNTTTVLKSDENGTVYYPVKAGAGTYNITASYGNASITKTLTVKTQSILNINIESVNEADDVMVYATLTDSANNKLTGDVLLEINGNYYRIIVKDGAGSRNLGQFKQAAYTYTAAYPGNDMLWSTNLTGSFKVNKDSYKITGNKNIIQYYGATKTYKIRLTNNNQPVKNEIITIKINKNTVKIKTDNQGYASLKLNLKAGKYTITATYKSAKASNKITIKPTLITKNKKIKKGKTLTYTAKLLNKKGKPLKNKKVTFKIKNRKYTAKTNKKGIAKIKVKNLKKGKHKILTTYKKQKNTNTVTVK
ncbi:Ig-like domain-containing protein [Methanobrevibacter thaueri]|uniref:Bacterial Ig-like domain (Group 1) n=1 Tax=Methanobrevibacter thaueri TaxID=190975 RepID=A0A315XNW1_9EURY|nr:Ig-like domain-containing protein [Methanobrevibacter thaueri]PWB87548.1 bacterial Ig-like domain (group 1) [Methanobrevibacter thaueri]